MSAWTNLLAASQLAIGTAWDLITHPKTGGSGVVLNNGAAIVLADGTVSVALDTSSHQIALANTQMTVTLDDRNFGVSMQPGITVQITAQPITI